VSPASELSWDQFEAVDMRVGRITRAEDFPEARVPAYKLEIDFGPELGVRRSSARITNYDRAGLEGGLVVAVVNFPPKQIGPVRSEVLVLGAVSADGVVRLLEPDEGSEPGERIA
jgi:tRNA-binding protein